MLPPFQKIHVVNRQLADESDYLLLANGSSIFTFDLGNGKYLAHWRVGDASESVVAEPERDGLEPDIDPTKGESPAKKRKITGPDTASDDSSAEIVIDHGEDTKRPPKKRTKDLPSVLHLCGSRDGKHVVVATDEDKAIRVLALSKNGRLSTLNERILPKKTSAITFSTDQQTILCADKFGDVYGLPLISEDVKKSDLGASNFSQGSASQSQEPHLFKPAASSLTVHTKKNLNTLKMQLAQSAKGLDTRKPRVAEYRPLLGHVSLLTDVLNVQVGTDKGTRSYILTADRDEHIRISRGIPQAHITEGFCLGHTQFVSRLCVPSWFPKILISGGGDDYLISWNWLSGSVRQKIMIRTELNRIREIYGSSQDTEPVVSGIWAIQTDAGSGKIVVACEGVAALLILDMDKEGTLSLSETLSLGSNVIDASVISSQKAIIYSLDNVRVPLSTTSIRKDSDIVQVGMHRWSDNGASWERLFDTPISELQSWISQQQQDPASTAGGQESGKALYALEHLRKRTGTEGIEQE